MKTTTRELSNVEKDNVSQSLRKNKEVESIIQHFMRKVGMQHMNRSDKPISIERCFLCGVQRDPKTLWPISLANLWSHGSKHRLGAEWICCTIQIKGVSDRPVRQVHAWLVILLNQYIL